MRKKTTNWMTAAFVLLMATLSTEANAQDKVETSVGADVMSGYVWRGQELGGVSIQPSLSVGYK